MRFRHPMIKSVVVERSTHEERRAAHLRLAVLFADQPERRGHHLGEAALAPDEDVAAAVEDGAHRTLRRGDVVGAISRLTRAADLSPDPKDRSRRLADAAYVGVASAGQIDSASELLRDAHRRDPTARRDAPRRGRHRLSPPQQRGQRADDSSPPDRRHRIGSGRARRRGATDSRKRCTRSCWCATTQDARSTGRRSTRR